MNMFKLRAPIQTKYMLRGYTCIITQLFGENKNNLFYGPKGHQGVDFKTQHHWEWVRTGSWMMDKGKFRNAKVLQKKADSYATQGFIPCTAAHAGELTTNIFNYDRRNGWYVKVTSDVMKEDGGEVQYQTLYFHLEAFWRSLATYAKGKNSLFRKETVRAGAIIGMCGNTGKYTTGAHLHFELRKRKKINGKWTKWEKLDPMPYFYQKDIVFQRYRMVGDNDLFHEGKKVKRSQITLNTPKVIKKYD